jgi:pimeloyl-ACP methyl ester carboxylesterase
MRRFGEYYDITLQKQAERVIKWNGTYDSPSQIIQPTLVLVGTEDVITTPKRSLLLVEKIPLVWLVQIREAGQQKDVSVS